MADKKEIDEKFKLEYQYQLFLKRLGMVEANIHAQQRQQLKQSFMGACSQMMLLFRDDLSKMPKKDSETVMSDMVGQVGAYFLSIDPKTQN